MNRQTVKEAAKVSASTLELKTNTDYIYRNGYVTGFAYGAAWQKEQGIDWISVDENGSPIAYVKSDLGGFRSVPVLVTDSFDISISKAIYNDNLTFIGWERSPLKSLVTYYAFINLPKAGEQ